MSRVRVTNLGKAHKQYHTHWSRLVEWLLPLDGPRYREWLG